MGEFLVATSSYGCPMARPFQPFGLCVETKKMLQKKKEEESNSPRLTWNQFQFQLPNVVQNIMHEAIAKVWGQKIKKLVDIFQQENYVRVIFPPTPSLSSGFFTISFFWSNFGIPQTFF